MTTFLFLLYMMPGITLYLTVCLSGKTEREQQIQPMQLLVCALFWPCVIAAVMLLDWMGRKA